MLLGFRCSLLFLFRRTVNNVIGDEANGQRRQQIQHRMLPEKNCGDRDQEGGYAKYDLPWQCGKWRLFHAANMTDMEPTTWSEGQTLVLVSKL